RLRRPFAGAYFLDKLWRTDPFDPFGMPLRCRRVIFTTVERVPMCSKLPAIVLVLSGFAVHSAGNAAELPSVVRHVVIYAEPGRFAGWPANHGIWSWGDEILVGFSRGYYKDRGRFHHIDHDRPEEFLLARSRDGGASWSVELPRPPGALAGTPGMRHGR